MLAFDFRGRTTDDSKKNLAAVRSEFPGAGGHHPLLKSYLYRERRVSLYLGTSAALNLVGAVRMARKLGKGKTVVTMLCDGRGRYQSKIYSPLQNKLTPARHGASFVEAF